MDLGLDIIATYADHTARYWNYSGIGINFPLYQKYISPKGRIIGVDITDAMLEQTQKRVTSNGWENVTFIQHDASPVRNPSPVNAVISTYALSIFPGADRVLKNIFNTLLPSGHLVLLELQIPSLKKSLS